jgi:hypothetical protein
LYVSIKQSIANDHRQTLDLFRGNTGRSFFNARNTKKNTVDSESSRVHDAMTKNEPIVAKSTSTAATRATKRTSRDVFWDYATQYSSRLNDTVKQSSLSTMNWLSAKIASSVQRNINHIRHRAQTSIETTRTVARQRMQDFRNRVSSNIQERTKSIVRRLSAPFQNGWKYIADTWRTTPIWNRFFWWSLSAIAVYGIATTLPTQLIKLAITHSTKPPTTTTIPASSSIDTQHTPQQADDKPNADPESEF